MVRFIIRVEDAGVARWVQEGSDLGGRETARAFDTRREALAYVDDHWLASFGVVRLEGVS